MQEQDLKKLIAQGEVLKAMEVLAKSGLAAEDHNDLIDLQRRWNDIIHKSDNHLIPWETSDLAKSIITYSLLGLIDRHFRRLNPDRHHPGPDPQAIKSDREIKLSVKELIEWRSEKTKKRHRQPCTFWLRLVESGQYIRVHALEGMPAGKLAQYLARDLNLVDKELEGLLIWRLEKADKALPPDQDLGASNIGENDVLYLTVEFKKKESLPNYRPYLHNHEWASPHSSRDNQVIGRTLREGRKVYVPPVNKKNGKGFPDKA